MLHNFFKPTQIFSVLSGQQSLFKVPNPFSLPFLLELIFTCLTMIQDQHACVVFRIIHLIG